MASGTIPLTGTSGVAGGSGSSGASSTTSSTTSPAPNDQLTGESFIQLLTAQLQAQDPLDPVDPTTFVTQLVQFNQLEQLIDINQTLSQTAAAPSTAATQQSASQAAAL
jgi:flagellar basal-body rod modification protein FlgD